MIIFYPISLLYGFFVSIREMLFKIGVMPSYKVKTKIVSVGNLTFGGTGKSPTVDFLLDNLKKQKKIAVISRGYGRLSTGFLKVNADEHNAAALYGDEPVLLSKLHPDVPVYVCEDRVEGCRQIEKLTPVDLIIADDAFQHLKLKRDIDIVVVDATEKMQNYNYPPVGRARNSFCYLNRAQFVFLTKTNLCRSENLIEIREKLKKYKVYEFESLIDGIYDLKTKQKLGIPLKEVFLMSGIGKPKTFENLISKNFSSITIKEHIVFKDHHNYTIEDIIKIKSKVSNQIVLTTEKDSVKLINFIDHLHICSAKLKFISKSPMENVFKEIIK